MSAHIETAKFAPTTVLRKLFAEHQLPVKSALEQLPGSNKELTQFLDSGNLPAALDLETLESWRSERVALGSTTAIYLLSRIIRSIAPEVIEAHFGSAAIYWSLSARTLCPSDAPEISNWLAKQKIALDDFTAASRAIQVHDSSKINTELLLKTYELARKLRAGQHGVENLAELLTRNLEPPLELDAKKLRRYELRPFVLDQAMGYAGYLREWNEIDFKSGDGFKRYDNLYADQTLGLLLLFNGQPQAIVSFVPMDLQTLHVVQLQGQKASIVNKQGEPMEDDQGRPLYVGSRGLIPLCLPSLLLEISIAFAKAQGFSRIELLGAENSSWNRGELELLERHRRIYDFTAEEHGFVQNEDGNWVTNLP